MNQSSTNRPAVTVCVAAIQTVPFYGDSLDAARDDAGRVWVSIRGVCDALGVDTSGQLAKLKTKPWACVEFISMQGAADVQRRGFAMINLDGLPMWLATIEASRVAPEARDALVRYQLEAAAVLRAYYYPAPSTAIAAAAPAPAPVASPDALAVLERVAAQMESLNARLEAVERRPSNANGPSLGAGAARIHVLGPLREVARIEASAMKRADKHAVMSLRTIAENQLRDRVDFPRYGGQSWAAFPENRLGELHAALARLLHDARKRAGVAAGKPAQMNLLPSAAKPRSPSA